MRVSPGGEARTPLFPQPAKEGAEMGFIVAVAVWVAFMLALHFMFPRTGHVD